MSRFEIVAVALSALWLTASAAFFLVLPEALSPLGPPGQFAMTLLAVFLPVAVIWVAAVSARSARLVRRESARMRAAVEGLRQTALAEARAAGASEGAARVEARLDAIEARADTALTEALASPAAPPPAPEPPAEAAQPDLDLGPEGAARPPTETEDLLRALHFPESADDHDGFAALRRVLQDPAHARLIQAAQDVLTLLAEDGIYVDDLRYAAPDPASWRAFADGGRGEAAAQIGAIRDRAPLVLTTARLTEDAVFRDAAHHFLRQFDRFLALFARRASDADLIALGRTRSARAFALLGRGTGVFGIRRAAG